MSQQIELFNNTEVSTPNVINPFIHANSDTRVRIILGTRESENGNGLIVDLVHARVIKYSDGTITLGCIRETKEGSNTFTCRFNKNQMFIERHAKYDNRIDVQLNETKDISDYQDEWLERNVDWSLLRG